MTTQAGQSQHRVDPLCRRHPLYALCTLNIAYIYLQYTYSMHLLHYCISTIHCTFTHFMYCDTQCVYCRLNYAIAYCRRNILRHTVVITLWYYTIVLFHFCTYCTAVLHAGIALYRWPGVRTSSPHAAFCLQTFRNHSARHNYNPGQVSSMFNNYTAL